MRRSSGVFSALVLAMYAAVPAIAFAQLPSETGVVATGAAAGIQGSGMALPQFIGTYFIQPVLGLVGLFAFVMAVYAGTLWMTAAGDSDKIDKAKDILRAVVIGAAILVSAYSISTALINALTTGSITGAGPTP